MGSCFGRCFSNVTDPFTFRYFRHTGSHTHEKEQVEKRHGRVPVSLELVEDTWKKKSNKYQRLESRNNASTGLTASPWSKVSTPNSLEWDSVGDNEACVDIETEQLLTEIERLTNKTLKETGEWSGAR
ncbi:hypothetical protein G9C98_004065 [Cotesia typhae]|uniref:Uncharacterized protein n=1 Tax=Cotesia typhae TaxID=2053667 RepID=A0A8J5R2K6_9HYME|nr:hypothetical protein G9C98_004065 [Cotesia typhae]